MMTTNRTPFILNLFFITIVLYSLVFFVGLRPLNAGNDTINYVLAYKDIGSVFTAYLSGLEYFHGANDIFFWTIAGIFKVFSSDPQLWLSFNIILTFFLVLYAYKTIIGKEQELWGLFLLFLFFTYELVFFANSIRQAYAVPLIALSLHYAYKKNFIFAIFYLVFSFFFHSSSILFLPAIILFRFFRQIQLNKIILFMLLTFFIIIAYFYLIHIIETIIQIINIESIKFKFENYIKSGFEGEMEGKSLFKSINFLSAFFIGIVYTIFLPQQSKLYMINLYFLLLFIFFLSFPVLEIRILQYYLFFYPILVFNIIDYFIPNRLLVYITTFSLFVLMFFTIITSNSAQYILGL